MAEISLRIKSLQPLDTAIQSNLSESTTKILFQLKRRRVLRMRFGIGMNTDHTLEEVGLQFSVTRERIRQMGKSFKSSSILVDLNN